MVEVRQLRKVFPNGIVALDGVDLHVPAGQIAGVIGRSGTGKSTLIRCINRLEQPTSGQVLVDGRDVTAMRGTELRATRRRIGMIFQQFNLLTSRTAAENVALPLEVAGVGRARRRRRALELLELVGLEDRAGSYPAQLSGGQKQRVGIARALASDPAVLLSDEATSALDAETTLSVLDLLRRINAELGLTVLLITHELDVVRRVCDTAALLDAGRVVEYGPLGDVVARPGSRLASGLLPALGRVEVAPDESAVEVVLLDDTADERLAAARGDGARVEARATERIGGRLVTRALLVTRDAAHAARLSEELTPA